MLRCYSLGRQFLLISGSDSLKMLPFLPKVINFNKRNPLNSRSGILGCQPMTKKELTSDKLIHIWRQSRCSIVFWNRHFFLSRLVFLIIYLRDVNTHTKTNKMCPWKPPLPQPLAPPSLRYSGINMNDTWTPIVKLRQMADLFSKICSSVFLCERVECVSPLGVNDNVLWTSF